MRVKTSRKGLYLTVMGTVAILFVAYLFISPMFVWNAEAARADVAVVVAIALSLVCVALYVWRSRKKRDVSMKRREGVVSGQNEQAVKP